MSRAAARDFPTENGSGAGSSDGTGAEAPTRLRASGGAPPLCGRAGAGAARDPAVSRDGAGAADWACFWRVLDGEVAAAVSSRRWSTASFLASADVVTFGS
jgi:hypothetical protein